MALDFGIMRPVNIGGQIQAGEEAAARNVLAQQQLKTGAIQQETSQLQLDQIKRDQAALANMQKAFVANGKTPDLESNFNEMIRSGIQHYVDIGTRGLQALQQQRQFATIMGGGAPAPAAAPVAAPAAAPVAAPAAIGGASTNALAAPTAPAAPVNALAAPVGPDVAEMRRKRDLLLGMGTTQSIAAARAMDADIALASKDPVYHTVPGVGLVDPRTGRTVAAAVEPTDPEIKRYEYAKKQGYAKSFTDFKREMAQAAAARTSVQLPPQEKAEQAERGKMLTQNYSDISKQASVAAKTLPSIDANLNILNKGFETGFGTETKAAGAKVLAALGVDSAEKFATNAQVFQAKATEAVLQKQLEQKGPQTESDAQRIDAIGSQLGKTPQANKFLLTTAKEQLRRDMEQRNFYDNWWKNNKTYDGAESAWFSGEGAKSLFDRPALKQYLAPTATAAQIPTTATPARAAPAAASNLTQERAAAAAAIAAGAPAAAVRARFKQNTGQEF